MAKARDDDSPETTPSAPDPWAIMDKLADALNAAKQHGGSEELMLKLTSALERVSESQLEGAKIVAAENRRLHRPSNEVTPGVSVFNRRGKVLPDSAEGPRKVPLKCTMMIPWLVDWESCTREEVDLLNLLEPGEYTLSLVDRSKIKMECRVDYKIDGVTPHRLLLDNKDTDGSRGTAFNNDNFRLIPPLSDLLRHLLKQHVPEIRAKAAAVLSDEEEEALIEAGRLSVSV